MWPFSKKKNELNVKFDTEAAAHAHHGNIVVTCREKGLVNASVRFAFVGMEVPPPLTKEIFEHIWTQAKRQGYTPLHMRNYNYNKPGHLSLVPAVDGSLNRAKPTAKGVADLTPEQIAAINARVAVALGSGTSWRNPTLVKAST